ncbi:proteasome assembly chaperone (PAC2) family protein [Luteococcus japonicus]|uniref:Proteasome assembly chaperone (PAC2) family protein n=1 Tax=Luteococcus japonicus TaxID=33984 RepID=A0A3N1ZRI6_9ACTN|nr:PAC2 family protein [Luteococcus japonicus]ROR53501.1 proteasome assembly chaperone (PAC2) family protein [Luteococcus japonicus]
MDGSLTNLRNPVVIMAFEGWNDASDAATSAIDHIGLSYDTDVVFEIDGEEYYDFQMNRPRVSITESTERDIEWPAVQIAVAHLPERDVVLVSGPEPNLKWRSFTSALVSAIRTVDPAMVVVLGAMLTDSPHSRPLPVTGTANDVRLATTLGLEPSNYEGPTGIVGILADGLRRAGMPVVSLWAQVPHYVSDSPNPKATLALLVRIEDLLDTPLALGELPELAQAWERGVDELASEDPDVAEYIRRLEAAQDEEDLPAATGDSIAAEFQRYLRRRNEGR